MKSITINPSVATIINIDPVGSNEIAPIYLKADENWAGSYTLTIWNSAKKNTELFTGDIELAEKVMHLIIAPEDMELPIGNHYYEIIHNDVERVIFKGALNIIE